MALSGLVIRYPIVSDFFPGFFCELILPKCYLMILNFLGNYLQKLLYLYICSTPNKSFKKSNSTFYTCICFPQTCRAIRTEYGLTEPRFWISSLESILTNTSSKKNPCEHRFGMICSIAVWTSLYYKEGIRSRLCLFSRGMKISFAQWSTARSYQLRNQLSGVLQWNFSSLLVFICKKL